MPRSSGLAAALCFLVLACSGGGDSTAPEPPEDNPPGDESPGPPQPTTPVIAGIYALRIVNGATAGEPVALENPDGELIGTYWFSESTRLTLTEQQTWSLSLHFEDQANEHEIEDGGRFRRYGDNGEDLVLQSDAYGDAVPGQAYDGMAFMIYDLDGDGQPDSALGFERTGQ